jgi:hypothetical protein
MTTEPAVIPLSDLWRILGGPPLEDGRGRAFWRNDSRHSIFIDDGAGLWRDSVTGERGGAIALIVIVRQCSPLEAGAWLNGELDLALWTAIVIGEVPPYEHLALVGDAA